MLLAGSVLTMERPGPTYHMSAEAVAEKLKNRQVEGVVKNPHAAQVLRVSESSASGTYLNLHRSVLVGNCACRHRIDTQ